MIEHYKQFNKMNQDMLKKFVKMVDDIQNNNTSNNKLNKNKPNIDFMKLSEYLNLNKLDKGKKKTKTDWQQDLFSGLNSDWEVKDLKEESVVNQESINYDFSCKIEKNNRR